MMISCKNCGQSNAGQSNFCRYCGMKFGHPVPPRQTPQQRPPQRPPQQMRPQQMQPQQMQPQTQQPRKAPRPYSWKTDEFQVGDQSARQTSNIEHMPVAPQPGHGQMARPLVGGPGHQIAAGYRCPRCASTAVPFSKRKISSAGWIVFATLLVLFFPLFWIGFLIKEDVVVCPVCDFRVN